MSYPDHICITLVFSSRSSEVRSIVNPGPEQGLIRARLRAGLEAME